MYKYLPLQQFLEEQDPNETIKLSLAQIAESVGTLPVSAVNRRQFWANSDNYQAKAWMGIGRRVSEVSMGQSVSFSPVSIPSSGQRKNILKSELNQNQKIETRKILIPILDGVVALEKLVKLAGYRSTLHAVAAHAVFLHPETVAQSGGSAIFPIARDPNRRGVIDREKSIMYDDNSTPTWLFERAAQRKKGPDVQFNHVWSDAKNIDIYTALWNICVTPAFLAKTTDGENHQAVTEALKYRSFELFGNHPAGEAIPKPPMGYETLEWKESPPPIDDLEKTLRSHLSTSPKSRPAICARELGWLFSEGVPDQSI